MPANKNKLLRMQTIIAMMRQKKYPNYPSFMTEMRRLDPAGAYVLSSKTFGRDIDDLKREFQAPIRYDSSRRGYFLTNPEWYSEELMVEPFEMKSALLGQRFAETLMPEPVRGEIVKAVNSLLMRNESGLDDKAVLEALQVINPNELPIDADIFCTVFRAWEERKRLRLVYCDAKGRSSEKLFEPHVLAWQGGVWYLKGEEYKGEEEPRIIVLAVHRIKEAESLGEFCNVNPDILASVKNGKLFELKRYPEVTIKVLSKAAERCRIRFQQTPATITENADGSILLTLKNLPEYEAVQLVFYTGGNAKVLSPPELNAKVRSYAEKILNLCDSAD